MSALIAARSTDPARGRRAWRVAVVLAVVVLLSLFDLVITLSYLTGGGMYEANPVVRGLVRWTGSASAIVGFKMATLTAGVAPLFRLRRQRQAEIAAWILLVALTWLSVQWVRYAEVVSGIVVTTAAEFTDADPRWIALDQQARSPGGKQHQ